MDDLIGDFVADARDAFDRLAPDLERWSHCPTDRPSLDAVFRFIHTVRGNAGFLAFERFERLCSPAEQVLADLRDGRRQDFDTAAHAIVVIIHRVGALASAIEAGVGLPAHDELAMVAQLGSATAPKRDFVRLAATISAPRARTVRMPAEQFEHLASCVETVSASYWQLHDKLATAIEPSILGPALADFSASIDQLTRALTLSRMQPLDRMFQGLERIVSQTASGLGKFVRFETRGGELLVDRDIVDALRDTMLHLVRNALDHGIETPDCRTRTGKAEEGVIFVEAKLVADRLRLTLSDDGMGIDIDAVGAAAIRQGLVLPCAPSALSDTQIVSIIAQPGLTTAQSPQRLSGLGVGLDAVRNTVERLGGKVLLENNPGQGTRFTLDIPLPQARVNAA
jgi:two-component system, chemotaxis family, sensor kinase CheA